MNAFKYLLVVLMLPYEGFSQVTANGEPQMTELISKIENGIPEGYRNPDAFIEGNRWKKSPEFARLQQSLQTKWPQALENIQQVAPTDTAKTILFVAAQNLDEESYIRFMSSAVILFKNGSIKNNRILSWALTPREKHLRGLLTDNYRRPEVISILQKSKEVFAGDEHFEHMPHFIDGILSGNVQKKYADFAVRSESTPPPRSTLEPSKNVSPRAGRPENTPAAKMSKATSGETPALSTERQMPVWPWVVGLFALIVIVPIVLKCRA